MNQDRNEPRDKYWAAEEDPDKLREMCIARVKAYRDALSDSHLWSLIFRNWRYYHNLYLGLGKEFSAQALKRVGEKGKLVHASYNHFRSFIRNVISIITREKEDFRAKAKNTDQQSIDEARIADAIIDDDLESRRIGKLFNRALEHAFIFCEGNIFTEWDYRAGKEIAAEEPEEQEEPEEYEEGEEPQPYKTQYVYEGACKSWTPTIFDAARDVSVVDRENHLWYILREQGMKWNLVEQFPDLEEDIIAHEEDKDSRWEIENLFFGDWSYSDQVYKYTLYHKKCDALPDGLQFSFLSDVSLDPVSMPLLYERGIQLRSIHDGDFLLNCFGYSVANDLQAPQEAYNAESSTICSNHAAFGVQNIWVRSGEKVRSELLRGQLQVIRSMQKPEPLALASTPKEVYQSRLENKKDMEELSGVNSVARGQPEKNLRSGTALALVDARAVTFMGPVARSRKECMEDVLTDRIMTLNQFAPEGHSRVYTVTGMHGVDIQRTFEKGKLDNVERIQIKLGGPLTRTVSGRLELVNLFINAGITLQPEQIITMLDSGTLDPMLEGTRSQLRIIREENEAMLQGKEVKAMRGDNHALHMHEHYTLLNTREIRFDEEKSSIVLAHLMEHMPLMMDPNEQLLLTMLGMPGATAAIPPVAASAGPNRNNGNGGAGAAYEQNRMPAEASADGM